MEHHDNTHRNLDLDLGQYCFCRCHRDVLELPHGQLVVHYGVHLENPLEQELACADCGPEHAPAEPWQGGPGGADEPTWS